MQQFILFYEEITDEDPNATPQKGSMALEIPEVDLILPAEMHEASEEDLNERHEIASHMEALIQCDNFRQLYVNDEILSRHVPRKVDNFKYWVGLPEPSKPKKESWWSKKWRTITRKYCGTCIRFDHDEGLKWRHEQTHKFEDDSSMEMWDDVLKMTAEQHDVPAIPDKDIAYCPKMERIVGRYNRPCKEHYKRR